MTDTQSYPKRRTQRFRRDAVYVAVRPIRLRRTATIQPGERIPAGFLRLYHLKNLYQNLRIGEEGDLWTKGQLIGWARKCHLDPIEIRDFEPPELGHDAETPIASSEGVHICDLGKGWFSVRDGDGNERQKLRGQAAVDEFLGQQPPEVPPPPPKVEDDEDEDDDEENTEGDG